MITLHTQYKTKTRHSFWIGNYLLEQDLALVTIKH